jgi:hypothetical protein
LIARIDQPQARQRDVLVLGQALGHEREELIERALVSELQQKLFEGVRSGRADLRPQHDPSLRERSFRKRKFAVETARLRRAIRDLCRREMSWKRLID